MLNHVKRVAVLLLLLAFWIIIFLRGGLTVDPPLILIVCLFISYFLLYRWLLFGRRDSRSVARSAYEWSLITNLFLNNSLLLYVFLVYIPSFLKRRTSDSNVPHEIEEFIQRGFTETLPWNTVAVLHVGLPVWRIFAVFLVFVFFLLLSLQLDNSTTFKPGENTQIGRAHV